MTAHETEAEGGAPDEELLAKLAGGNRAALRDLYHRHAGRLIRLASGIVGDRTMAEDCVHDAFVIVCERAGSFEPSMGAPRAWLSTIVRNRAIDAIRKSSRRRAILKANPVSAEDEIDNAPSPEERASLSQDRTRLDACLEELRADQSALIVAVYSKGLSHREAARLTGEPVGTIKSRIRRGLIALRECLS
ncbi:MAG: RNA polymerase sigma factor [Azospirillaceae bacterium]